MAPPSRSGSRPGRALAGLAVLILVMFFSITAGQTFNPANWHNQFKVGLGLDLSSGTEVVLQAQTAKGAPSAAEMQQAISVLESRVNGTGNSGAQVQQQGADLINVSVPGKAANDVINLVSSTAKLAFRPVLLAQTYTAPAAATPKCHLVGQGQRLGESVAHQPRPPRRRAPPRLPARARRPRPRTTPPSWRAPPPRRPAPLPPRRARHRARARPPRPAPPPRPALPQHRRRRPRAAPLSATRPR